MDYIIKYHHNLVTGLHAGMPIDQRNPRDDAEAWRYARSSKFLVDLYRQFRPVSNEQGSCGCGEAKEPSLPTEAPCDRSEGQGCSGQSKA